MHFEELTLLSTNKVNFIEAQHNAEKEWDVATLCQKNKFKFLCDFKLFRRDLKHKNVSYKEI